MGGQEEAREGTQGRKLEREAKEGKTVCVGKKCGGNRETGRVDIAGASQDEQEGLDLNVVDGNP